MYYLCRPTYLYNFFFYIGLFIDGVIYLWCYFMMVLLIALWMV